jgi:hypothetical protein
MQEVERHPLASRVGWLCAGLTSFSFRLQPAVSMLISLENPWRALCFHDGANPHHAISKDR